MRTVSIEQRAVRTLGKEAQMKIGKPRRVYTVEPVREPVPAEPAKEPERVEPPKPVPAK